MAMIVIVKASLTVKAQVGSDAEERGRQTVGGWVSCVVNHEASPAGERESKGGSEGADDKE